MMKPEAIAEQIRVLVETAGRLTSRAAALDFLERVGIIPVRRKKRGVKTVKK